MDDASGIGTSARLADYRVGPRIKEALSIGAVHFKRPALPDQKQLASGDSLKRIVGKPPPAHRVGTSKPSWVGRLARCFHGECVVIN
jgi:hypothetical protein